MGKNKNSLVLNIICNGVLSLSQILFPLITFPYITRVLGVEANGANSFALSTVKYFALFATLGMATYGVKACAQVKDDRKELSKVVHELLMISLIPTIAILTVLYVCIAFLPAFSNYSVLMFIYSLDIVFNIIGINWLYQAIENFSYITTRAILFKLIAMAMMFLFVKSPKDVAIYAFISIFASCGGNIINIIYSRKFIDYKRIGNYNLKKHMKPILFLFATALAVNIYSNMDSVMLGLFCGDYDTGIYYVAVKVKTILITLVSSFSVVIMSRLAYTKTNSEQGIINLLKRSYSVIIFITVPVVLFFIMFAKESILFLSGEAYMESVMPMRILMPTIFISAVSQILGNQYSVSAGKEKNLMIAVISGAVINLVANLILIPTLSYNGAAIGTILAEMMQCIIQMVLAKDIVYKVFSSRKFVGSFLGAFLAGVVSIILAKFIKLSSPFFVLAVNSIAFFSVYVGFMIFIKYDICIHIIKIVYKTIEKKK